MCEKCREINEKIERYRRPAGQITDQQFSERIEGLTAELEAQKVALHLSNSKGCCNWPGQFGS
jgi:hypothetical protein